MGVPIHNLPGARRGLHCCNRAGETLEQERCWARLVTSPSQRGLPGCQRCPAWEKPLFPALNLKMMLQTPESRDSPQPPQYLLQPREGGLPSPAWEFRIGPASGRNAFSPKTWDIFFPHVSLYHNQGNSGSPCSAGVK